MHENATETAAGIGQDGEETVAEPQARRESSQQ